MLKKLRPPSPAMVVALIALLIALGGTASVGPGEDLAYGYISCGDGERVIAGGYRCGDNEDDNNASTPSDRRTTCT